MSLKLHRINSFQQILNLYPSPFCPKKLKTYFEKLDNLTLRRIRRLRKYMYSSTVFAKEEVLRCADAIKDFNPGPWSRSHKAMLLLSVELHKSQDSANSQNKLEN